MHEPRRMASVNLLTTELSEAIKTVEVDFMHKGSAFYAMPQDNKAISWHPRTRNICEKKTLRLVDGAHHNSTTSCVRLFIVNLLS